MKTFKLIAILLFLFLPAVLSTTPTPKKIDPWKQWIKEVEPIITRLERSVAKLLQTVEERKRFQELFWKARNPNPHNPRNEYKLEYYRPGLCKKKVRWRSFRQGKNLYSPGRTLPGRALLRARTGSGMRDVGIQNRRQAWSFPFYEYCVL